MKSIVAQVCAVLSVCCVVVCEARTIELKGNGVSVKIDDAKGSYDIVREKPAQRFSGSIGAELERVMQGGGQDELGKFESVSFLDAGIEREIHVYSDRPII